MMNNTLPYYANKLKRLFLNYNYSHENIKKIKSGQVQYNLALMYDAGAGVSRALSKILN